MQSEKKYIYIHGHSIPRERHADQPPPSFRQFEFRQANNVIKQISKRDLSNDLRFDAVE